MELKRLIELLRNGEKRGEPGGKLLGEVTSLFGKEQFCAMVEKAKQHIHEGNIFQIVLSNRLSAPFEGSLLNTYRVLRTINPSPYMFYFSGTDVEVAGASPETLVKLENGVLHTFPLAGTRPRGKNDEEDKALETELLADEKELAEHNMLVDLGRNDLGKISKFGTVQVEKLHSVERFSHVMHIGSTVRGEITEKHLMPLKRYCLPEHFPVHRRSGLVSLSENLKTTSGESMAAPLDTSTSQEIWTPVLRFVSPTRKTGRFLLEAEPGSWQIPYLKRSMKNASTKPDPR